MPDVKARDAKLIQYLNEAHVKERQLEQALEAHIAMTELATYRKRLKQHLSETKNHARQVERRGSTCFRLLGVSAVGEQPASGDDAERLQEATDVR